MECIFGNNQSVAETSFNIRLNNHQDDVKKADAILASKYFQQESHDSK